MSGHGGRTLAVGCSLLLTCLVWRRPAAAGTPVERAGPSPQTKNLELLEFVLRNHDEWRHVLNQKVRLTRELRPPYHDGAGANDQVSAATRAKLRLLQTDAADPATAETATPLPVIRRVVDRYSWVGSYVEHAARLLHESLTCLTTQYVSLQLELIVMLAKKMSAGDGDATRVHVELRVSEADSAVLLDMFGAVRAAVAVYADKLAALHSDMELMADVSFLLAELLADNTAYSVFILSLMRVELEKIVDDRCVRTGANELYGHFGHAADHGHLVADEAPTAGQDIRNAFEAVVNGSVNMYNEFGVRTVSFANWDQILDFRVPIRNGTNFYLGIMALLHKDELGIQILATQWKDYKTSQLTVEKQAKIAGS